MKKTIILFIFLVSSVFANGILRTDGTKIVDADGTEIIFRGIGLGGWLVMEGYMFNMSGFANSQTEIRNKIIDLVGEENADLYFKEFVEHFVTEADVDSIANWGFNMIRIPLHFEYLTPRDTPYTYSEEGFAVIDSMVAWCKKNDLYLILDLHAAPGGQSAEPISDYNGFPSLWEYEEYRLQTVDLWREIASRYADEETIAGYDVLNEPAWDLGSQNTDLRNLLVSITNAIRTVDTNHIVYAEGNWFATQFNGLTPTWDDNMSYSFHHYWKDNDLNSIQGFLGMRSSTDAPLWMSESGENSNSWFTDFVGVLEDNSIGWTWWTHKKYAAISSLTSAPVSPHFQTLLDYWNRGGSKPSVEYSMAALLSQVENNKIENCNINYDVIDALLKLPHENSLTPYGENTIPGIIYGVDFDKGNLGTAYYDATPSNTGSGSYNNGWVYRNEGVDIEVCSDALTNGYNIGWIESGEWLKYTVNVTQAGTYKIKFRVSAQNAGGMVQLLLNNQNLTSTIQVPVTGGWQNWQTIQVDDIDLPAGEHELMLRFFFAGFNFNLMEFELVTVGVEDENEPILEFNLAQNYPNPFNPSTVIKYTIPAAEKGIALNNKTTLKVYDILGNEIAALVNKIETPGNYEIKFDASHLPTGVYFYKLQSGSFTQSKKMMLVK